jgi:hypothetical protein
MHLIFSIKLKGFFERSLKCCVDFDRDVEHD